MTSLFQPIKLGALGLSNRVVMAPLTRSRATEDRIPSDLMRSYYCQRASAGLIISEATAVSPQGVGYPNTPGIWCSAQVEAWRQIVDAVHKKDGKIILQLWHVGRVSDPEFLHGQIPVAPSAIAAPGKLTLSNFESRPYVTPRALHIDEIKTIVSDFAEAAAKAREAGFDGIDIHAGNGYLIDQFLHQSSNQRQDEYGGSIQNRSKLLLEIVNACVGVWGNGRVGVNLSPHSNIHGMKDAETELLFTYLAKQLGNMGLAFLFVRQAKNQENLTLKIKKLFNDKVIVNQDFSLETATNTVENKFADAIAFGKDFISNPDLVERFKVGADLNPWDKSTFYAKGPKGYTDYPLLKDCCADSSSCSD